jgi:hypothetical protein
MFLPKAKRKTDIHFRHGNNGGVIVCCHSTVLRLFTIVDKYCGDKEHHAV